MTRRRLNAPGRRRSDAPLPGPGLLLPRLFLLLVLLVSACDASAVTEPPGTTEAPSPAQTAPADPDAAVPTESSAAGEPSASGAAQDTTPSDHPSSAGLPGTGSAAGCSGSDENRDFYASMAAAVDWTVYCPVLAEGWFVADGHYRLAGGGWMEISYDGPADASFVLRQGGFCSTGDGCVPSGQVIAETAFGDRTGTLAATADGGWSIVADRGGSPSWLVVVHGLDEAGARAIARDLLIVAD